MINYVRQISDLVYGRWYYNYIPVIYSTKKVHNPIEILNLYDPKNAGKTLRYHDELVGVEDPIDDYTRYRLVKYNSEGYVTSISYNGIRMENNRCVEFEYAEGKLVSYSSKFGKRRPGVNAKFEYEDDQLFKVSLTREVLNESFGEEETEEIIFRYSEARGYRRDEEILSVCVTGRDESLQYRLVSGKRNYMSLMTKAPNRYYNERKGRLSLAGERIEISNEVAGIDISGNTIYSTRYTRCFDGDIMGSPITYVGNSSINEQGKMTMISLEIISENSRFLELDQNEHFKTIINFGYQDETGELISIQTKYFDNFYNRNILTSSSVVTATFNENGKINGYKHVRYNSYDEDTNIKIEEVSDAE